MRIWRVCLHSASFLSSNVPSLLSLFLRYVPSFSRSISLFGGKLHLRQILRFCSREKCEPSIFEIFV